MSKLVKITERGWPAHFRLGDRCVYHRNTLVEFGESRVVVSTVGNLRIDNKMTRIGSDRYYETAAFHAKLENGYWDSDYDREVALSPGWAITAASPKFLPDNVDTVADRMHEAAVVVIAARLSGELECI